MEVFSAQPSAPELPLGSLDLANNDPIQIHNIDGLGPVKADISSTPFATGKGELYQGSSVPKRNIVIALGLNPNWEDQTISSLRHLLYGYLMPQAWCKLRFFSDDMPVVDIEGYVESLEPNIFAQDPELQCSIICPKPDFIEVDAIIFDGVVGDSALEFDYYGNVDTGFELRVDGATALPAYTGQLSVIATPVGLDPQTFVINPVTINALKSFKLTTMQNQKRAQNFALSDGAITNLLQAVTQAVWPQLKPGSNSFQVTAATPGQQWTLAYFTRFGGL